MERTYARTHSEPVARNVSNAGGGSRMLVARARPAGRQGALEHGGLPAGRGRDEPAVRRGASRGDEPDGEGRRQPARQDRRHTVVPGGHRRDRDGLGRGSRRHHPGGGARAPGAEARAQTEAAVGLRAADRGAPRGGPVPRGRRADVGARPAARHPGRLRRLHGRMGAGLPGPGRADRDRRGVGLPAPDRHAHRVGQRLSHRPAGLYLPDQGASQDSAKADRRRLRAVQPDAHGHRAVVPRGAEGRAADAPARPRSRSTPVSGSRS